MTSREAVAILRQHNLWRRDNTGELEMVDVTQLGIALEMAIDALAPVSPAFRIPGANGHMRTPLEALIDEACAIQHLADSDERLITNEECERIADIHKAVGILTT